MERDEALASGTAALEAGRWEAARHAFAAALERRESPEALLGLGAALWWLGEVRPSVEYYERAFAAYRRAGDTVAAAGAAMWLCLSYKADLGNQAAASGWIARAERLLRETGPGPMQGWLWLTRGYETTDLSRTREFAERALEFARGSGDVDLELCALGDLGEALVGMGQVEEGFALIDEAMAGTLGGERRRLDTVVFTSCSMLIACELAADLERATQWCRVAEAFIRQYGCPFLHVECRTRYGGVLVATGHWADAERELTTALRITTDAWPAMHAQAVARLADLRLRQGRLDEAAQLLVDVDDWLATALPAAAVRLACGEPSVAIVLLRRLLHRLDENYVGTASTLELLVEACLAAGELGPAATSAERLAKLARGRDHSHIAARASLAQARVAMARGDADAGIRLFEEAVDRFSRLALPFETARARLALARAIGQGQPAVAIVEAQCALVAFEQLGAAADADASAAFLRSLGVAGRTGLRQTGALTQREQEVLRLIGLGLSNPEIAQRLVISRKTAAHHVSSVLAKLGLRNRAEAAAYATRTMART
jgi:DNA-binding CsgD family transcriptional regulator